MKQHATSAAKDSHYRKLERMYELAPINRFYQPTLTVGQGTAEVLIPMDPKFHHAAGAAHGSVYFKAMDDAAFFAVNSLVEDAFVLTSSFHVHLLRPIAHGSMRAEGRVVHEGKTQFIAEAVLYDAERRVIARGSGTFVKSNIKLSPEMGYQV